MKKIIAAMSLVFFFATAGYAQVLPPVTDKALNSVMYFSNIICSERDLMISVLESQGQFPSVDGPGTIYLPNKEKTAPVLVPGLVEVFLSGAPDYAFTMTTTFPYPNDTPSGMRLCILAVGKGLAPSIESESTEEEDL